MGNFKVINWEKDKYVLNEIEANTFEERKQKLFGYPHVMLHNGDQHLPLNDHLEIEVGKFKVIWVVNNWVGYAAPNNYRKIQEGFSVYISHKWDNYSLKYIFIREYPNVSTIDKYFQILDYYQNFRNEEYLDLMLNLGNTIAHFREATGTNVIVNTRYHKSIYGMTPISTEKALDPVNQMALSNLSFKP